MFAPAKFGATPPQESRSLINPSLWNQDAIHRAKNLAQLTLSLASLVSRPSRFCPAAEAAAPALALARSYDILSNDAGVGVPVPCLGVPTEIAVQLGQIFGRARNIAVTVVGDEVSLVPEQRRALVLICSELVINALKYAFPVAGRGTVTVTLRRLPDSIFLIVEDDGIGFQTANQRGEGSGLLDRLVLVSSATLTRGTGRGGRGARVEIAIPQTVRTSVGGPVPRAA